MYHLVVDWRVNENGYRVVYLMDEQELIDSQEVNKRGIIRTLGKFEGEPLWTWYVWLAWVMNGGGDTVDDGLTSYDIFTIDDELTCMFPELEEDKGKHLILWESDTGFVNHSIVNEEEYVEFLNECEEALEGVEEEL